MSGTAQQAARLTDPVTHGLGMAGIVGGVLLGAAAGALLVAALPATAGALVIGLTVAAATGAVAGGGLAGHQLISGIQRAGGLLSPTTGLIGMMGSPNVRIGMLPAARAQAEFAMACHGLFGSCHYPIPPVPPAPIAEGASTIRINGLFAARVGSRTVCGASVQRGAVAVYYGGPTQQVLAIVDLESLLLEGLGFLAKTSLIAAGLFTIPLGLGAVATFGTLFAAYAALNYGVGELGDRLGTGWRDILQGGGGLLALVGTARAQRLLNVSQPEAFGGFAVGKASKRPFDPDQCGGPIRSLTTKYVRITKKGIEVVERHLSRFEPAKENTGMIDRLKRIEAGEIAPEQVDLNFYTHELREFVRYKKLGFLTGNPSHEIWENAHTATLEDYGLQEGPGVLYHPDVVRND